VTHPAVSTAVAFALEMAMTALLVGVIVACVSSAKLARFTPLAIGPILALLIWLLAPETGTSLNPARSAGPAIAFGDLRALWLYAFAPTAGALAVTLSQRPARASPNQHANPCCIDSNRGTRERRDRVHG